MLLCVGGGLLSVRKQRGGEWHTDVQSACSCAYSVVSDCTVWHTQGEHDEVSATATLIQQHRPPSNGRRTAEVPVASTETLPAAMQLCQWYLQVLQH